MPQTQTNLSDIIDRISSKMNADEKFNDIELATLRREVEKLPTLCEREHCFGILFTQENKRELAIKSFENALASNKANAVVYSNYWISLKYLGLDSNAIDRGLELARQSNTPSLFLDVLIWLIVRLDAEGYMECYESLRKMKKLETDEQISLSLNECKTLQIFSSNNIIDLITFKKIGEIVINLAASNSVTLLGNLIQHKKQRSHLSISYCIDSESYSSDAVAELNFLLADNLIDSNLTEIPVVVKFIRVDKNFLDQKMDLSVHVSN